MTQCDYLLPKTDVLLTPPEDEGIYPCLREQGHEGDHITLVANGGYISWLPATDCDCHLTSDDHCGCLEYHYLSKKNAEKLILVKT